MSNSKDVSHLYCACTISGNVRECDPPCTKRPFVEYLAERWPESTVSLEPIQPIQSMQFVGVPTAEWEATQSELSNLRRFFDLAMILYDAEDGDFSGLSEDDKAWAREFVRNRRGKV